MFGWGQCQIPSYPGLGIVINKVTSVRKPCVRESTLGK